jgi:methionine-rich copper-binding protein CopC
MAANWTVNDVLDQLNSGRKWSTNTITYAFPTASSGLPNQGESAGFRAVNSSQQALMTLALATWDEAIPQGFALATSGSTDIEFAYTSTNIGYAHAYFPTNGSVYFNATKDDLVTTSVGAYGFQTFIHEIGHALGLNHMGDYNGNGNWSPSSYQDSVVLSVMSYFGPRNAAPNFSAEVAQADWVGDDQRLHSPQTPMVNDLLAIQAMYGTSTTTRPGDTVYGFNSTAAGPLSGIHDFSLNRYPVLTLFDSGGNDTLDLSGWATASRIDLAPGAYSSGNAMTNNVAIALSTTIENAVGGAGNDVIAGNSVANRLVGNAGNDQISGLEGDDVLEGGAGNDTLDGGAGNDMAVFGAGFASFSITVSGNAVTLVSAATGSDRVIAVERFQFSDGIRSLAELSGGVAGDTTAPQLQTLAPADDSGSAPPGANLLAVFNEPMKAGSGSVSIFNADGSLFRSIAVTDATQLQVIGSTVTINPAADMLAGRSYYVTYPTGAFTDLAGNSATGLSGSANWNFSVASNDITAPQLVTQNPADDSGIASPSSDLVLQFNESVVAGAGNIQIRANGQLLRNILVGDTSQVRIDGGTVTINPSIDLPAGSVVTVLVDNGALRDLAGNAFMGITSLLGWNFSVSAATTDDYPYDTVTNGVVTVNGPATSGVIETGGDQDLFRVQLQANVAYTFELDRSPGGLSDPYLTVWNADLDLVAQDDDSGGGGNARAGFTPSASGTYFLGVFDYLDSGTGAYTLRATKQDGQAPTALTLAPADDTEAVSISADLVITFSEAVRAGSGVITLMNDRGSVVREIRADDSDAVHIEGTTVTIDPGANLPPGTALSVMVEPSAFSDIAGNAFAGIADDTSWTFSTASVTASDDFPLSINTPGVLLVNGAATAGQIDYVDDGDLFRVSLTAGVTYRFDLVSPSTSDVDPYLMLFGMQPEVELIAYDDDGGTLPLDSQLYFTPDVSGEYYLAAYDYAEATGRYTLQATAVFDDVIGSRATAATLTTNGIGQPGRVNAPTDVDFFAVSLTAGEQYTFELWGDDRSGLRDPYLTLIDAQGTLLTADDDTGIDLNALLTWTVSTSGTYYLGAMDFDSGVGGYQISGFARNQVFGGSRDDDLTGTNARDSLLAGSGNDVMRGGQGDDILQGDAGIDLGRYAGSIGNYELENMQGMAWVVRDLVSTEGRDLLYGVERLQFDDGYWAIDLDGHAGTTVKFLGAVFGPASVDNEGYVGIGLTLLDSGMSTTSLMQLALDARLGEGNVTPTSVVNLLYANLFGELPDTATRQLYEGIINDGSYSMVGLALAAAETEWNLQNIDFVGIAAHGIAYSL